MTASETPAEVNYVLRRPASVETRAIERSKPDLADELLELRAALEREIAERDREVAERGTRPPEAGSDSIDMASRIKSAIRIAFDHFRSH
jgi:hypothetical protein